MSNSPHDRIALLNSPASSTPFSIPAFGENPLGLSDEVQEAVIAYVDKQFNNSTRIFKFEDSRGAHSFRLVMSFSRSILSMSDLQVSMLKWELINDLLGITLGIVRNRGLEHFQYEQYLSQQYSGILHGDGKARVDFRPTSSTLAEKEYYSETKEKCVYHLVPEMQDIVSEFSNSISDFADADDGSPVCTYARRLLGGGSQGGWATER